MICRKAELSDVPRLAELRIKQLIDEGGVPGGDILPELVSFFTDGLTDGTLSVFAAEENGCVIATAGVCYFRYPPTFTNPAGKVAYITNVYTCDEYRGRGVASALMEAVMEEIKAAGCGMARLHSSAQGRKLYERLGFREAEGFMAKKL